MSDDFNDKHLLWWVLKAIDSVGDGLETVFHDMDLIDAPDWVEPALREKIEAFKKP